MKEKVALEPVLPATRSPDATPNVTDVTAPPITPETAAADKVGSALVCTVTEPPAVAAPMARPVSVTVTAVLAASAVPEVAMTMEVAPGAAGVSVAPLAECTTEGVTDVKKPDG